MLLRVTAMSGAGVATPAGPVDVLRQQSLASATPDSRQCWDCTYVDQETRQYMPGDTVIRLRPVGGSFSYHF